MSNNVPSQQAVDKESIFMTENYGGLNLESSPMNMPFTDSPSVTNVEIEPSGKIKKRRGSKVVADFMEYTDIHIPYRLGNGKLIHIITDRDTIRVLDDGYGITSSTDARVLYSTGLSLVPSPTYTYKSNYSPKRTYLVVKEGDTTKFHFFTKKTVPVTLEITEVRGTFEYTSGVTHHVVPLSGSNFFETIDQTKPTSAYFVADADGLWRNGSVYTADYLHLTDETGVITDESPKSSTGSIVHFNWSWEADVQWRTKGHFEYNFKRFNVAPSIDNSIELSPEMKVSIANDYSLGKELMYDMNAVFAGYSDTYPALMAGEIEALAFTDTQFFANSHVQPCIQTNNAFTWTPTFGETARAGKLSATTNQNGSVSEFQVGLTHIFWGGLYYSDAAFTVPYVSYSYTMLKLMGVYVGGGVGEVANNLEFISKETVQTMYTTTGFTDTRNMYRGYKKSATAGRIENCGNLDTDVIRFAAFTSGSPVGCTGIDTTLTYIPSSLVATGCVLTGTYPSKEAAKSRNFVGLYPWINWKYYQFFNVSTLFQDRVTLAGFELDPSVILLGNTGNQTQIYQGAKYSNFEVNWADSTLATAPVEIRLTMEADERVTSMVQWHDSLFVGTTRKLYRIHGGQNVAVTPTNYFVDNVANVPCAYRSMVLTNDGVVFLSDSGVYRVGVDTNSGQFRVDNIGIKIRKALREGLDKGRLYNGLGRIAYDSINNVIYVLVGDKSSLTPRRCFVYYADKQSWVEWSLPSGYFPATSVSCYDGRVFFTICETTESDSEWNGTEFLGSTLAEFNIDNLFIDLEKTSLMDDTVLNVQLKLPVTRSIYTKAASPTGFQAVFDLENPDSGVGLKTLPVASLGYIKTGNVPTVNVNVIKSLANTNILGLTTSDIYKSIDRGLTWTYLSTLSTTIDDLTQLANGDVLVTNRTDDKVYRSTDNGATWDAGVACGGGSDGIRGIVETTSGEILVCSNTTGKVFGSSDGGASYSLYSTIASGLYAMEQLASGDVMVYNFSNGKVYRSADDGATWDAGVLVVSGGRKLCQLSNGTILLPVYTTDKLYSSSDDGVTWTLLANFPDSTCMVGIDQLSNGTVCATATMQKVLYASTDNGVNWHPLWSSSSSEGVEDTDFITRKGTTIVATDAFIDAEESLRVSVVGEDGNLPLIIRDNSTDVIIDPADIRLFNSLTQSTGFTALCSPADEYDGVSVTYGLAYPTWWLSPAFTRNNVTVSKTMRHFYAVFENSIGVQTNNTIAPTWYAAPKVNLSIVQNGSRTGQSSTAITDEADPSDISSTSDAGLDYYRVVYPIEGNFISFQAFVYSFDNGNWELVGYQLETEANGRTSRRPYD